MMNRREFLAAGMAGLGLVAAGVSTGRRVRAAELDVPTSPDGKFTEWGWPLPYERVSPSSVSWLKSKGWWPLVWAYQPAWMSEHTIPAVIGALGLDRRRGLEIQVRPFLSGPATNEGLIAGSVHLGAGACGPVQSLIDKRVPVKSTGVMWAGVHEQSMMVRPNSTIKGPGDLKGKVVGLVVGSSSDMALRAYCQTHGINPRRDFTVKPMTIPEQILMPEGIDMVVLWSAHPRLMWEHRKNAVVFNDTADYFQCWCQQHARAELFEAVPDVMQAIADMATEAMLYARLHLDEATRFVKQDPATDAYPYEILYKENVIMVQNLKPTWIYPFVEAYAPESARVARWMYEDGRTRNLVTEEDFAKFLGAGVPFMKRTFQKLGWRVPQTPPSWPKWMTVAKFREVVRKAERRDWVIAPWRMSSSQPWPEPGDLERPWYFNGRYYQPEKV